MRFYRRSAIPLIIGLLMFDALSAGRAAGAQEKQRYYFKAPPGISKFIQQHVIDVGDVPGHQLRIYELAAKWGDKGPSYYGVKVVEGWTRGFSDYTYGSGRATTYGTSFMENGDKIFSRSDIVTKTVEGPDGSKKSRFDSVVTLLGGTGRFQGIRGTLRHAGATDFKTGLSDVETEGEYWIEK